MEAARARRAALLNGGTPANLPTEARPKPTAPAPEETVEPTAPSAPEPTLAPEAAPVDDIAADPAPTPRRSPVRRIVWILVLLLIGLILIAVYQARMGDQAPASVNAFRPAPLQDRTTAAPLLIARPGPISPVLPDGAPRPLPQVAADAPAFVETPVVVERGPSLTSEIDTLAPPPARPADLVLQTGDAG
ncbi:MAG: hypothetical protein HKO04_04425 [Silicimonas sp.]|nr:hypothetical protein [Silicimonas sp.]